MIAQPYDFTNLIHIYAVNIGEKTFPMEIYWSCKVSDNNASLINPIEIEELIGRHEKYMQMHDWTYENLKDFGNSPQLLCEELNNSFENQIIFVADDELEKTKLLLKELFSVGKVQLKNFGLKSLDKCLLEIIQDQETFNKLKEKATEKKYIVDGVSKFLYLKDLVRLVINESRLNIMKKFSSVILVALSFLTVNCSKTETAAVTEYAEVCTAANKEKDVTVQGFLQVADKVPCMNMLNPKRDCAFKFADKINVVGKEIIVYLQEGDGKNETETPEAGKSAFQSKPTSVFTRDQIKFRLNDGTVVTPQVDVATPVTLTGKVRITDGDNICTISVAKIEKR